MSDAGLSPGHSKWTGVAGLETVLEERGTPMTQSFSFRGPLGSYRGKGGAEQEGNPWT